MAEGGAIGEMGVACGLWAWLGKRTGEEPAIGGVAKGGASSNGAGGGRGLIEGAWPPRGKGGVA